MPESKMADGEVYEVIHRIEPLRGGECRSAPELRAEIAVRAPFAYLPAVVYSLMDMIEVGILYGSETRVIPRDDERRRVEGWKSGSTNEF